MQAVILRYSQFNKLPIHHSAPPNHATADANQAAANVASRRGVTHSEDSLISSSSASISLDLPMIGLGHCDWQGRDSTPSLPLLKHGWFLFALGSRPKMAVFCCKRIWTPYNTTWPQFYIKPVKEFLQGMLYLHWKCTLIIILRIYLLPIAKTPVHRVWVRCSHCN